MFTGLVECTGVVRHKISVADGARYGIEIPFAPELQLGDSVAVNGCCLTVDRISEGVVEFDLLTQTMRVTSLGQLEVGDICNLERAMSGSGRFGGPFVMGHVDTVARLSDIRKVGQDHMIRIVIPQEYSRYTIDKGSICLDGISLTIANIITETELEFWITPHTWQRTNLHALQQGDILNIEVDMIAKYAEKMLRPSSTQTS